MTRNATVVRHMSKDELERKYKEEKNPRVKGDYSLYCCSTKERGYMRLVPGIVKRARSSIEGWLRR